MPNPQLGGKDEALISPLSSLFMHSPFFSPSTPPLPLTFVNNLLKNVFFSVVG